MGLNDKSKESSGAVVRAWRKDSKSSVDVRSFSYAVKERREEEDRASHIIIKPILPKPNPEISRMFKYLFDSSN